MAHLSDGTLRRLVDEPAAVPDSLRRHYLDCTHCRERYSLVVEDARFAAGSLDLEPAPVRPAAALQMLHQRVAAEGIAARTRRSEKRLGFFTPRQRLSTRRRTWLPTGVLATLALVSALIWTPANSLAQSFIGLFQPTQVAAIQTTSAELKSLRGLRHYGTVHASHFAPSAKAATAAEASTISGMQVLTPAPGTSNVPTGAPAYTVEPSNTASFTFSAAKAQAAAAASGKTLPTMPARINGSTLKVTIGTTLITEYGASSDLPQLVIGQMRAPAVTSTRVSLATLENYVLGLPQVSPQLASQIRAISDPTSTLPIPIPVDLVNAHNVDVQGVHGVEVGDNTGLGSGVIWEKGGIVYAVGGLLTEDQSLTIANALR
jgi:hypothetical protein